MSDPVAEVDVAAEFNGDGPLAAQVREMDIDLRVKTPDPHPPLSAGEPHATLSVTGEGLTVDVVLDAEGLDGLVDALHHAQGGDGSDAPSVGSRVGGGGDDE